ncbi:MAG TPA: hypothetical protein VGC03_14380, partial [Acidimicrobiia bacterium]
VDFTAQALSEAIGNHVVIYPVSALSALQAKQRGDASGVEGSGMSRFERDFAAFLIDEKAAVLAKSAARRAERLIAEETNTVRVEAETLRLPVDEATVLVTRLEEVAARTATSRRDLEALLEMEIRELMGTVEADLATLGPVETDRLLAEAHRFLDAHPNPRSAADELDTAIKASLRRSINTWQQTEDLKLAETFKAATDRFSTETAALVERTTRLCSQLFDIELTPPPQDESFDIDSEFTFAFFDPPDEMQLAVEAIRRRTPKSIARRMLQRKVDDDIPILVDKHCGRLRWDYSQRLDKIRTRMTGELTERLDGTLSSLRRGIERARSRHAASESDLMATTAELEETLRRLQSVADRLRGVNETLPPAPDPAPTSNLTHGATT